MYERIASSGSGVNPDFRKACEPLVKYLNENHHPHTTVIVTPVGAEIMEGVQYEKIEEFIKD